MENIAYESDTSYLERFTDGLGIPLRFVTTRFDASTDRRKTPCFLCSWMRRKQLFNLAQETGCNKIALGHHQDDVLITALMNAFFQGSFSSMPPLLKMDKMPLSVIRPLCLEKEQDIRDYAQWRQYEKQNRLCPHEHASYRTGVARMFYEMESANPEIRHSLWKAVKDTWREKAEK